MTPTAETGQPRAVPDSWLWHLHRPRKRRRSNNRELRNSKDSATPQSSGGLITTLGYTARIP